MGHSATRCADRLAPRQGPGGYFTLSFDFELIWGTLDLFGVEGFRRQCEVERGLVVDALLRLLSEYEIRATWFVVGHLMLERCDPAARPKHPEMVRPAGSQLQGDWYDRDPGGDETSAPLFFARSLVERIKNCPVHQEIGCHTFSHVVFGDCTRDVAESEIVGSVRAARSLDLDLRSIAFPRNRVGHLEIVAAHGIRAFRGPEPRWYSAANVPTAVGRAAHLLEAALATTPPVVWPERAGPLVNVPGSMVFLPRHGVRRGIPVRQRVRRAIKGVDAAVRNRRLFHLWMHPTNLADDCDAMLDGLRTVLRHVAERRAAGLLTCASVSEMAALLLPIDAGPSRDMA